MNYLVTMATHGEDGTEDRTSTLDCLKHQCRDFGVEVDDRFIWDWHRFKTTHLFQAHRHLMSMKHSLGHWMWKPYIILDALHQLQPNDVVCYMDSDLSFNKSPAAYIEQARKHHIKLMGIPYKNSDFTDGVCFAEMNMDTERYRIANQVWAAFLFVSVCSFSMRFITDWLAYCTNERMQHIEGNIMHRWDQSILTNLAIYEKVDHTDTFDIGIFAHPSVPAHSLKGC